MLVLLLLVILVVLPAVVGVGRARLPFVWRALSSEGNYGPAPRSFIACQETSTCPSPDALDIYPAERGELYYYLAKKYWRVEEVLQDGWIVALTPLMEHHYLRRDDPNLRKANLLERLRYAARFPYLA